MFFVASRTTADLALTTPTGFCCNCGARGELDLVETPLQKTRYFLVFGTELTLRETFPYCGRCKRTAKRVRLGWLAKMLAVCLVTSVVFLAMVFLAPSLPSAVGSNLFRSSVIISVILTLAYFYVQEWGRKGRTYYQPVSLVDAAIGDGSLNHLKLKFFNPAYARLFTKANAELISAGVLEVDVHKARY